MAPHGQATARSTNQFQCGEGCCSATFSRRADLDRHRAEKYQKPCTVQGCSYLWRRRDRYKKHMKKCHAGFSFSWTVAEGFGQAHNQQEIAQYYASAQDLSTGSQVDESSSSKSHHLTWTQYFPQSEAETDEQSLRPYSPYIYTSAWSDQPWLCSWANVNDWLATQCDTNQSYISSPPLGSSSQNHLPVITSTLEYTGNGFMGGQDMQMGESSEDTLNEDALHEVYHVWG